MPAVFSRVFMGLTSLLKLVSIANYIAGPKSRKNGESSAQDREASPQGSRACPAGARGSGGGGPPALHRHPPAAAGATAGCSQRGGPGAALGIVGTGVWRSQNAGRTGVGRTGEAAHHEPDRVRPGAQPAG